MRRDLVDTLDDLHVLHTPGWRNAFLDIPREAFLPRFFRPVNGRHEAVDHDHPEWLNLVYRNAVWPTQLDGDSTAWDRARRDGPIAGEPTCSSTMPSLMALMLESLDVTDNHTVLEIGSGTGYNAALLAHRLGHDHVTSVDIDPDLVDTARHQLAATGYRPTLITADGAGGHPDRAPYDRLIATCSIPAIPPAWLTQVRPGGKLITHLYRDLGGGALIQLTVDSPGIAHGHFLADYGTFMPTRLFIRTTTTDLFRRAVHQDGDTRPVTLDPGLSVADDSQPFVLLAALHMPGTHRLEFQPNDAGPQLWLLHPDGSWAVHDIDTHTVEQGGRQRLWDAVEDIYHRWTAAGKPARERFGLMIAADQEWIWLDEPAEQTTGAV
ncbi:MAG TPA: protein-L-isoaspartate(D-aspartate) O-methyltransferase [Micromonosporaceae bacterium]|nr:protein-L-isoaspartate(D-aspartate) O-methyltransferase [Micromonosporaceae bacterium]